MRPLSARERRLVALFILLLLLAAAYLLVIAPIAAGFAARAERRAQLTLRYAHNLRTIGAIPRLRRQAEQARAATGSFVVEARSIDVGREWLKARLRRTVEGMDGEFRDGSDVETSDGRARVRATVRMTLPQLTAALTKLQNEPPWLIVETIGVTADDALVTGQSSAMDIDIEAAIPLRPSPAR